MRPDPIHTNTGLQHALGVWGRKEGRRRDRGGGPWELVAPKRERERERDEFGDCCR